jgi:hypothetical protein
MNKNKKSKKLLKIGRHRIIESIVLHIYQVIKIKKREEKEKEYKEYKSPLLDLILKLHICIYKYIYFIIY